jgi:hypothetical protein
MSIARDGTPASNLPADMRIANARPVVAPIADPDLREVTAFLHEQLNPAIPADRWAESFRQPWGRDKPNNGFMMRDSEGRLAGVIGAIYSTQTIRGQRERFCNITSWCVTPPFRTHAVRLAMALLAQPGFHFTDFTPTPVVLSTLRFLKFKSMDSRGCVMPNIPAVRRTDVIDAVPAMTDALEPIDRTTLLDHAECPWLRHVAIRYDGGSCYVAYRLGTLRGFVCADVVHVTSPAALASTLPQLRDYLLLRARLPFLRIERRLLPSPPRLSHTVDGYYTKQYRSDTLHEADISNLYSELVALPM